MRLRVIRAYCGLKKRIVMVQHLRRSAAVRTNLSSLGLSFARVCRAPTLTCFGGIFDRHLSLCGIRLTARY